MTFNYHWKSMESLVGTTNLVFCSDYNVPTLFPKSTKISYNVQGMWPSKHVTHCGPRLGFLYYNLTAPSNQEGTPLSTTWVRAEKPCGLESWEPSLVPSQ